MPQNNLSKAIGLALKLLNHNNSIEVVEQMLRDSNEFSEETIAEALLSAKAIRSVFGKIRPSE